MFTRGYAKHPCKQIKHSQGVAVRPIRPYRRIRVYDAERDGLRLSLIHI